MSRSTISPPEKKLVTEAIARILGDIDVERYGFRAQLLAELSAVFKSLKIKENPPPRSSVDRWLSGRTTPTLQRFLLLELALQRVRCRQIADDKAGEEECRLERERAKSK